LLGPLIEAFSVDFSVDSAGLFGTVVRLAHYRIIKPYIMQQTTMGVRLSALTRGKIRMLDGTRYSEFFAEQIPEVNRSEETTSHPQPLVAPETKALLEKLLRELQDFLAPPQA